VEFRDSQEQGLRIYKLTSFNFSNLNGEYIQCLKNNQDLHKIMIY